MAFVDAANMNGMGQVVPLPGLAQPYVDDGEFIEGDEPVSEHQEHPHARLIRWIDTDNIAKELSDDELNKIGQQVLREFELDDSSRSEWLEQNKDAFKLAMQVAEKKTHPWPNASNVIFPLMTVASVQFAARAYPAIVAGREVVKGGVLGSDKGQPQMGLDGTPAVRMVPGPDGQQQPQPIWQVEPGEKRKRADKIASHMSWQLLHEMEDWEEDTDKLLHILPIAGCCFRKSYFDPATGANISELASAENIVINYWAKSMARAQRISEILWRYPHEIEEMVRMGIWLDQDFLVSQGEDDEGKIDGEDTDAPREFIEQHRRLDLDGDGYAEPYIVTVHKTSGKVARIVARYDEDSITIRNGEVVRIKSVQYYTKYDFLPNPEGGIYGIGFGKLLSPLNHSVNTVINQLIDAGTLANTPSGFIGRGLSMNSGAVRFKMGEFKVINAPGSRIREAIVPMEFKEPSTVLFSLLGLLIEAAKDVGSSKPVLTGETISANMSPTTMMGMIDQGLQVFSGIYKRVHRAAKKEFDKLYRLNRIYLEDETGFPNDDGWQEITREDYNDDVAVYPVSDPSQVSSMQKMARAELLRAHYGDPLTDQMEIRRRVFDAAEMPDIDDLLVEQQGPDPAAMAMAAQMELEQKKIQIEEAKVQLQAQMDALKEQREAALYRAKEIETYAHAVNYLAQADKASADNDIEWTKRQLEFLKLRMEGLNGRTAPVKRSGGDGNGKRQPPFPDARLAPDGSFYVPDDTRPGKWLRVIEDMAA